MVRTVLQQPTTVAPAGSRGINAPTVDSRGVLSSARLFLGLSIVAWKQALAFGTMPIFQKGAQSDRHVSGYYSTSRDERPAPRRLRPAPLEYTEGRSADPRRLSHSQHPAKI
ncbi:hypothetical protein JHW43_005139 [Diplocarpon mali]|nr:hypothetical protein JHW43_005139 [Diplocarpon mali]